MLVFYAGIGFVVEGDNFIGTKDTYALTLASVHETAMNLTTLQETLRQRADASILVMDTSFIRARARVSTTTAPRDQKK